MKNPNHETKKKLINSYLLLIQQKSDAEITIDHIADAAEVHRRTFYRHFQSKHEMLTYYCAYLLQQYIAMFEADEKMTFDRMVYCFFSFALKNKRFMEIFIENNYEAYLLEVFNSFETILAPLCASDEQGSDSYAVTYRIGGFWNVLLQWLKKGAHETPEEMVNALAYITLSQN